MTSNDVAPARLLGGRTDGEHLPLVIATMHRPDGITGVQTHVRQLRQYLQHQGTTVPLVTPFSWGGPLTLPVFGLRLVVSRLNGAAGVAWHRHWHEVFLRKALRRELRGLGPCIVYAQGPLAARAALRARRGPHQRVIMAIHFRVSQADEWVDKHLIDRDGMVFRQIRRVEQDVIPQVDGLISVSRWARDALVEWLPEAAAVPYTVIGNFVAAVEPPPDLELLGDLVTVGNLELVKNHRYLLEVLAEAKRLGRTYTLDVFGQGACRADLLEQASALGLDDQVRFHGFRTDVREFLPRYRAYVHAAYSEACPLAIIEAMAAGLPVLAGRLETLTELVDEGEEGWFFPLNDATRAARTIIDLLDREPERARAGRAASTRFEREFDADLLAPRLLSFLGSDPVSWRTPSQAET